MPTTRTVLPLLTSIVSPSTTRVTRYSRGLSLGAGCVRGIAGAADSDSRSDADAESDADSEADADFGADADADSAGAEAGSDDASVAVVTALFSLSSPPMM